MEISGFEGETSGNATVLVQVGDEEGINPSGCGGSDHIWIVFHIIESHQDMLMFGIWSW